LFPHSNYEPRKAIRSSHAQVKSAKEGSEAFSLLLRASTGITAVASVAVAQNALGPHLEAVGCENYVNRMAHPTAGDSRNADETHLGSNLKPNPKLLSEASEIYERVLSQVV
jgi:hypothetical protein